MDNMSGEKDKRFPKALSHRFSAIFNVPEERGGESFNHSETSSNNLPVCNSDTETYASTNNLINEKSVTRRPVSLRPEKGGETPNLRRKPPPPMFDELTLHTQKSNDRDTDNHANTNGVIDMITHLENEIDNLKFNDEKSSNYSGSNYLSLSETSTKLLPVSHQLPLVAQSGIDREMSIPAHSSTSNVKLSLNELQKSSNSLPYPVDMPLTSTDLDSENTQKKLDKDSSSSNLLSEHYDSASSQDFHEATPFSKSIENFSSGQNVHYNRNADVSPNLGMTSQDSGYSLKQNSVPSLANRLDSSQILTIPLKPIISAPIDSSIKTLNSIDQKANITTSQFGHKKSGSITSLWSSNSYRSVNLATLKRTLSLKPGEGERSQYVMTIRRNSGTAFNESGPSKWKLPIGIAPFDKSYRYASTSGRSMRFSGPQGRLKKSSGVELKHGHLKPRLLAAEVEEIDDSIGGRKSKLARSNTGLKRHYISTSAALGSSSTLSNSESRSSSLKRTGTTNSFSMDLQSVKSGSSSALPSLKRSESGSSSSGSISDSNIGVSLYYQHPGYKYDDEEDEDETEVELMDQKLSSQNGYESYEDGPRLTLANPDTISTGDSE
ncbi:uncharacterized protein PRCAT00001728001 [Priceomyces carsonii]|uniref:uncharacterized protein n=1 Tax=Priceomyces carsonii TaxID=28549 RepID=UPI002ED7BD87|nr:unnamed protein product [Priceomyces carsonii]